MSQNLPVIPMRSTVLFPGVTLPIAAGRAQTIKAIEATSTIKDGADEIEVAAHLPAIFAFDVDSARAELMEVVRAARSTRRDVVIRATFEVGLFERLGGERFERAVETLCRATRESGCDGVVTSSGFGAGGSASPTAIAALKTHAEGLTIKASVEDGPAATLAAIESGADVVGTTAPAVLLGVTCERS